jgi:hypothetical protein
MIIQRVLGFLFDDCFSMDTYLTWFMGTLIELMYICLCAVYLGQ